MNTAGGIVNAGESYTRKEGSVDGKLVTIEDEGAFVDAKVVAGDWEGGHSSQGKWCAVSHSEFASTCSQSCCVTQLVPDDSLVRNA